MHAVIHQYVGTGRQAQRDVCACSSRIRTVLFIVHNTMNLNTVHVLFSSACVMLSYSLIKQHCGQPYTQTPPAEQCWAPGI